MRESHRQIDGFARSSSPLHMNKGISDSSPRVVSLRAVLYLPWARINISLLLWDPIFRRGNGLRPEICQTKSTSSPGEIDEMGKKSYLWISQWKFMAWLLAAGTVHSKVKNSLGVQWLRIRLPVQGTHVQSLAGEPSKMPRAAGHLCAAATEPVLQGGAHRPQPRPEAARIRQGNNKVPTWG